MVFTALELKFEELAPGAGVLAGETLEVRAPSPTQLTAFVFDTDVVALFVFIVAEFELIVGDSRLEFDPDDGFETLVPPLPLLPPSVT